MILNLRATSAPDLLATVPAITGFSARNSVVCLMFVGEASCGAIRVDLPARRRERSYRAVADGLISLLSRSSVDRVVPVIYTDQTFERERCIPWLELGRLLRNRLTDAGFPCLDAFCVAADGYASYLDRDYPREGRPLREIEHNKLALQLAKAIPEPVDLARWGHLPTADPEIAEQVSQMIALLEGLRDQPNDCADEDIERAEQLLDSIEALGEPDPVSWVETCVAAESPVPLEAEVWLLLLAQSPAQRDLIMVQFAFGREAGELTAELNAHFDKRSRATGLTMDQIAAKEFESGGSRRAYQLTDKLLGESRERPNLDRIYRAIEVIAHVTSHASERYRPAALTMLAWLFWCLGLGSVASRHLDDALRIAPEYGLAKLLAGLISSGRLPRWVLGGIS